TQRGVYGHDDTAVPLERLMAALDKRCTVVRSDQVAVKVDGGTIAPQVKRALKKPDGGKLQPGELWVDYLLYGSGSRCPEAAGARRRSTAAPCGRSSISGGWTAWTSCPRVGRLRVRRRVDGGAPPARARGRVPRPHGARARARVRAALARRPRAEAATPRVHPHRPSGGHVRSRVPRRRDPRSAPPPPGAVPERDRAQSCPGGQAQQEGLPDAVADGAAGGGRKHARRAPRVSARARRRGVGGVPGGAAAR